MMLYRGTSLEKAVNLTKTGPQRANFQSTGDGEFGNGCYFWLDDKAAAFLSAVQYAGVEKDWAVISVELDDAALLNQMVPPAEFGPKVLEFEHARESPFKASSSQGRRLSSNFVTPWDYSHYQKPGETSEDASLRAKNPKPAEGSFGKMDSEAFRNINADPKSYKLEDKKNQLAWQYELIIGLCAADYAEKALVQVKAANGGLTYINVRGTRAIVLKGTKITKKVQNVNNWKMKDRDKLWELYVEGKPQPINLDDAIG